MSITEPRFAPGTDLMYWRSYVEMLIGKSIYRAGRLADGVLSCQRRDPDWIRSPNRSWQEVAEADVPAKLTAAVDTKFAKARQPQQLRLHLALTSQ